MHSAPIRAYLLRDDGAMTTLEKSLKRFCRCYWALSGIPPHSILAPVEVLTALILEWHQLGGALQQDVGEILQRLRIASVTAVTLPPQQCNYLRRRHNARGAGCSNYAELQHLLAALMGQCGHQLGQHSVSSIVPGRGVSCGLRE